MEKEPYVIPVVLQESNKPVNGRIFTDECLAKIAEQFKDQKLYGEKVPYLTTDEDDRKKLDFNNLAVSFTNIHFQNQKLYADATIHDPLIQEMLKLEIPFTYGIRAFTQVDDQNQIIPDSIKVISYDIMLKGKDD